MAFFCFSVCVLLTIVGLPIHSALMGWRMREVWGAVLDRRVEVDGGAFRSTSVASYKPRGVPLVVWIVGVSGAFFGPVTGLLFAPAGLLGCLIFSQGDPLTAFVTLGASLSGFGLAFGLVRVSRALLTCEWGALQLARQIGTWSLIHHGVLALTFGIHQVQGLEGALAALVPALIGVAHAGLLFAAGEVVGAIQTTLTREALEEARGLSAGQLA